MNRQGLKPVMIAGLDTHEPYAGMGVPIPEEQMFGAAPSPAFDGAQDAKLRGVGMQDRSQTYPLKRLNQELLIELGTVYGHEGSDWQNPYAWASRGVLNYPNPASSGLVPRYGLVASTPQEVAANIRATAGALEV